LLVRARDIGNKRHGGWSSHDATLFRPLAYNIVVITSFNFGVHYQIQCTIVSIVTRLQVRRPRNCWISDGQEVFVLAEHPDWLWGPASLTFSGYRRGFFFTGVKQSGGTRWRTWLRHCGTSRKVAGSIPDGVIGIFH
jgi:hypothetical protein